MGTSGSTPYNTVLEKFPKDFDYIVYEYNGTNFLLQRIPPRENYDISINIAELRPVSKSDQEPIEVFLDSDEKSYTFLEEDILESVPKFTVFSFSDYVYLDFLYATKSRTGKYYESLMSKIAKDIDAKGIWLLDASKGGRCKDFSLSLQLFISEGPKQFKTYYETLGYSFAGDFKDSFSRDEFMSKLKAGNFYAINEYAGEIREYIRRLRESPAKKYPEEIDLFLCVQGVLNIFEEHGDINQNLIMYLNSLINDGKCLEATALLTFGKLESAMHGFRENKILENFLYILKFLNETKYGTYVKTFDS